MATRTTGLVEAMDELEAITARIRDLSPVLTVAARDTKTLIDDSFRRSRSPDGSAWSPLAPSTVKTHVQRLYEKLGVGDRAAAVAEAMRRGMLD